MKDKLTKHGKNRKRFLVRRILIVSSIILLAGATIAIPVGVSISQANIQQRK